MTRTTLEKRDVRRMELRERGARLERTTCWILSRGRDADERATDLFTHPEETSQCWNHTRPQPPIAADRRPCKDFTGKMAEDRGDCRCLRLKKLLYDSIKSSCKKWRSRD